MERASAAMPFVTSPATRVPVGSVETRWYLAGTQYYIDPAPYVHPEMSAAEAQAIAFQMESTTTLQRVVLGYFHDTANDRPDAEPLLVYVVTFTHEECVPSLPAPPPDATSVAVIVEPVPCDSALVIDATTGSPVISFVGVN